ncbi:MAG: hypothetical protein IPP65_08285 [Chlorobi bacterium]|nr:hypothetical protein [Chlorobiota bacterium]
MSVEIYFVLYLSATLLLLSTSPKEKASKTNSKLESALTSMIKGEFRLGVKKAAMIYPILPGVIKNISTDKLDVDSTNIIEAIGKVHDLKFEIISIQDSSTRLEVNQESARLEMINESKAKFLWIPSNKLKSSAVYYATIKATALPNIPNYITDKDTREYINSILKKRGRLSDSVTFTINVINVNENNALNIAEMIKSNNSLSSVSNKVNDSLSVFTQSQLNLENSNRLIESIPFELNNNLNLIRSVPNATWNNKILVTGALANKDIEFFIKGNAEISSRTQTSIVLTGIAPIIGESKVEVTAKRKDGRIATSYFQINTTPLIPPQIPKTLIAGETYRFDFTSDGTPNDQISLAVFENEKLVLSNNQTSAIVSYTPVNQGKLLIKRYISNQKSDEFAIDIVTAPKPNISQPKQIADEAIVTTTSFGKFKGLPNKAKLIVDSGNALDPEEVTEKYRFDNVNQSHIQTWRIKIKDKNQDFTFHAYALDQRGSLSKSNPVNFKGD